MSLFPIDILTKSSTPLYYYDLHLLEETLSELLRAASIDSRFKVHYAIKANASPRLLQIISNHGLGADCVSGNEIKRAIETGFNPHDIVFAGVGKTDKEITTALNLEIGCLNVESQQELKVINDIATKLRKKAPVSIRVNPGIDAHTHRYITTGLNENKFGITLTQLDEVITFAQTLPAVNLIGLHFHIGSQLTDLTPYKMLCLKINELIEKFSSRDIIFKTINVGGGLGINYLNPDLNPIPDFDAYFSIFKENLNIDKNQEIHFELGRSVVGQCGSLISRVLYIKEGLSRRFAIIDAGMTDLIRPALYQARHEITPLTTSRNAPILTYDVVGPICESSDTFATEVELPELHRGDLIAIRSAGAYGETMASRYNLRDLPSTLYSHSS